MQSVKLELGGLCSSTALVLNLPNTQPFNSLPHVEVTPTIKLFLLLLHKCNYITVMNCSVIFLEIEVC